MSAKPKKPKRAPQGRKFQMARWTVERAASEWGLDRRTLSNALRSEGVEAGADGAFSTRDIDRAIHGDLDAEKLRLTREQADEKWLANQRTKEALVERSAVKLFLERTFSNIRQKILASALNEDEKDEVLLDLKALGESQWAKEIDEPLKV